MPQRRLTIYLLQDVSDFHEAVDSSKAEEAAMAAGWQDSARFYYGSTPLRSPAWVGFVDPVLASSPTTLRSSSASGLLLLKVEDEFFALTFGYGRSFLDQSKIRRQFGLRVALNAIDPAQMRSLDTKTFEDMVVSRNIQTSRSTDLPAFNVDISRDILRAVVGEPRDLTLAKRIAGSDALVVNRDLSVSDLPGFCERLLDLHLRDAYKADFSWVDQLALVEDASLTGRLDEQLINQLIHRDTSNTHLAMPDTLDWADIDVFRINGTRQTVYDDLDLEQYLLQLKGKLATTTLTQLRQRKVSVKFSRGDEFDPKWSVYQCLVSEQRMDDNLYALVEGRWFAIAETLSAEVDAYVEALPESTVAFPQALKAETENTYNARLSQSAVDLLNLDAKIKRPGGAASGIEFCDVLTTGNELIHVKRKSRSSTLSHLFAQGRISATTFLTDGEYRNRVRDAIHKAGPTNASWLSVVPTDAEDVNTRNYKISYVVITDSKQPRHDWLPFFSKLNLMQTGRELSRMGFALSLTKVPVA